MRMTYDKDVDCAYWTLQENVKICNPQIVVEDERMGATVVIDLDADGQIVGIEVVFVSAKGKKS